MKTGAALAPLWVGVMEASSSWGVPPWTWAGGKPIIWFIRQRVLAREKSKEN